MMKIPLLAMVRPKIFRLDEKYCVVKAPLNFVTKNHVGSMYFGAMSMAAELSTAAYIVDQIQNHGLKSQFIFKDFSCEFLKRAEKDIYFVCPAIPAIQELVQKIQMSEERFEGSFEGYAVDDKNHIEDPSQKIMTYRLTISMKALRKK